MSMSLRQDCAERLCHSAPTDNCGTPGEKHHTLTHFGSCPIVSRAVKNWKHLIVFPVLIHAAWPTSVKLNSWWPFLREKKSSNPGVHRTAELLQETFWWVIMQLSIAFGSEDIKNILQLHSFHSGSLLQIIFLPLCTAIYILCRIFIHVTLTASIAGYLFTYYSAYATILDSCSVALFGAIQQQWL